MTLASCCSLRLSCSFEDKTTRTFLKNAMKQDRLCATSSSQINAELINFFVGATHRKSFLRLDDAEIESILNTVKVRQKWSNCGAWELIEGEKEQSGCDMESWNINQSSAAAIASTRSSASSTSLARARQSSKKADWEPRNLAWDEQPRSCSYFPLRVTMCVFVSIFRLSFHHTKFFSKHLSHCSCLFFCRVFFFIHTKGGKPSFVFYLKNLPTNPSNISQPPTFPTNSQVQIHIPNIPTRFFVTQSGSMEVSVKSIVCNTIGEGCAFGGLALLYNCPRTATVKATTDSQVWGAPWFKQVWSVLLGLLMLVTWFGYGWFKNYEIWLWIKKA